MSLTYDAPRLIRGWSVEVLCPACDGVLEHVAHGRPWPRESFALARCTSCRRRWKAKLNLIDVSTETSVWGR